MKLCQDYNGEKITVYTVREFIYRGEKFIMLENPFLFQQSMTFKEFEAFLVDHKELKIEF